METKILKTHTFEPMLIKKAKGSWFWDTKGKKYLDCESGTWVVNLGHNHPKVVNSIRKQASKLIHRGMRFLTQEALDAADALLRFIPNEYEKVTFLNSGSEAVDFAINFAKKATGKTKILSLKDSYLGAFGVAKEASYTSPFSSKLKIQYPECSSEECHCLDEYGALIDMIIDEYSSELACFALEPIMVSGGIHKPCTKFINELCKRLQESGVLIVIDEVTSGFGRTGYRFGYEHFEIYPDVIAIGKPIGNGYPVSAVVTKSEFETKIPFADLYYAQSHQLDPIGTAVASTVIQIFEEEEIIEKSYDRIDQFNEFFQNLKHPCIKEIRSVGMIFGLEIQNYQTYSSKELILRMKDELLKEGIMIGLSLGKDLLRLLPPLTITEKEINFFKKKFMKVLNLIG
ncbi:MAG: aspartate aminotransferase family protein [Candidatus Thorarchaeota archaeon]